VQTPDTPGGQRKLRSAGDHTHSHGDFVHSHSDEHTHGLAHQG
jgi:hypothetical protein